MPTKFPQILGRLRKGILDFPTYPLGETAGSDSFIRMDRNENPLGPSPRVINALRNAVTQVNRYPPSVVDSLKERIADFLERDPKGILIGDGSNKIIDFIVKSFVDPGDEVIISIPTFAMYEIFARLAGGKIRLVQKRRGFRWDVDAIIKSISPRTKLVFICSPNNPTGLAITEDEIEPIVEENVLVVLDEAYAEFSDSSLVQSVDGRENVIVLRTFSKAFGLAGLRIGYAVSNAGLVEILERVVPPFSVNILALVAAEAALGDRDYLMRTRRLVESGRTYLYGALNKINGITAYPSKANFLLVRVNGISSGEVVRGLADRGVLIRDCAGIRGLDPHFVRISIGKRRENEFLIEALREFMAEVRG